MEYQKGQVLLIVVLVMVTALTVGLSVAARTITNMRTTQDAQSSEQAFTAAEAGLEQSLTDNKNVSGKFDTNVRYQTVVRTVSGMEFAINNAAPVLKDDSADIWLSQYPTYTNTWTGTMTLYWGEPGDVCTNNESTNTAAALEVVVLSGTSSNPQSTLYAFDPCNTRSLQNKFEYVAPNGGTIGGKTYKYRRTITVNSGLLVRVIPLYAPVMLGVRGCDSAGNNCRTLPSQGTVIESTGVAGETTRKIVSTKPYPKVPTEFFPYSFFIPQ